jgi:hypothetical protein
LTGHSKTYRLPKGLRLFLLIGGVFSFGLGVVFFREWIIRNVPEGDPVNYIFIIMISILFLFGIFLLIPVFLNKLIMIEGDKLKVFGLFKNRVYERGNILAYSIYNVSGMNNLELHLPAPKEKIKKVKIPLLFNIDQHFNDWLDGIPLKQFGEK